MSSSEATPCSGQRSGCGEGARESDVVYLGQPPLRIDILRRIDGVDDSVFDRAVSTTWNGTTVSVIGLDDLIANKRAAARPQDLVDAELLERVRAVAAADDERD